MVRCRQLWHRHCRAGTDIIKATLAAKAATDLGPGGYALMPAQMHHWLVTRTAATVQVHGMGPFALTYVNPADAPKPPPAK